MPRYARLGGLVAFGTLLLSTPLPPRSADPGPAPARGLARAASSRARADCSEKPLSLEELDRLADRAPGDLVAFLKAIPAGSLQTFTLVENSLSLQNGRFGQRRPPRAGHERGVVSPRWPRAIRASTDGKLAVAFVCDKANPSYGTVEVLSFDDRTRAFTATEYDFRKPAGRGADRRVHANPESCVACHSSGAAPGPRAPIKPIWPEYPFWLDCDRGRGISIYGGSDDSIGAGEARGRTTENKEPPDGCTSGTDAAAVKAQRRDFKQYKPAWRADPCFMTLPWATTDAPPFQYDPYTDNPKYDSGRGNFDYDQRPNFRITQSLSINLARRNLGLIAASPDYAVLKYYLGLEAASCLESADLARINAVRPGLDLQAIGALDQSTAEERHPLLFGLGRRAGLRVADWSMEHKADVGSDYATSFANLEAAAEVGIDGIAATTLVMDLQREDEKLRAAAPVTLLPNFEGLFGAAYACLDRREATFAESDKGPDSKLCQALRAGNARHLAELAPKAAPAATRALTAPRAPTIHAPDTATAQRGRALAQTGGRGDCARCHSPAGARSASMRPESIFIPLGPGSGSALQTLSRRQREDAPPFLEQVDGVMSRGQMPLPPAAGAGNLTAAEQADVLAYLRSLLPSP